jgi:hypothetical protein
MIPLPLLPLNFLHLLIFTITPPFSGTFAEMGGLFVFWLGTWFFAVAAVAAVAYHYPVDFIYYFIISYFIL